MEIYKHLAKFDRAFSQFRLERIGGLLDALEEAERRGVPPEALHISIQLPEEHGPVVVTPQKDSVQVVEPTEGESHSVGVGETFIEDESNGEKERISVDKEEDGTSQLWKCPCETQNSTETCPCDIEKQEAVDAETAIAAGIVVVAKDTGRVLLLQRSLQDGEDDPNAGLWEFPGGRLEEGETSIAGAKREWEEEVGVELPEGEMVDSWLSPNGKYRGYVYLVSSEQDVPIITDPDQLQIRNPDDPDGDAIEALAWWEIEHLPDMSALRPEMNDTPWEMLRAAAKGEIQLEKEGSVAGGTAMTGSDISTPIAGRGEKFKEIDANELTGEISKESSGAMVALMVPPDIAKELAFDNGELAENLHLTLAYLPDVEDGKMQEILKAVQSFSGNAMAISGKIGGMGRFNGSESSDDKDVFYASFDSPDLLEFRSNLVKTLENSGLSVSQDHGFTPHISLKYLGPSEDLPADRLPDIPILFNYLTVAKDDKKRHFQLLPPRMLKLLKSDDDRYIIYGLGSTDLIDRQGHSISIDALRRAFPKFMASGFPLVQVFHTDICVGKVIPEYVTPNGERYVSEVDDKGLWAVVELRKDIEASKNLIKEIEVGNINSFSIAGNATAFNTECDVHGCHVNITDLEIYELSCCLVGQTKVITNNGIKNIEDVMVGEKVLTHKERFRPVLALVQHTVAETIYDVYLDGQKVSMTAEHPVLVKRRGENNWIAARNLLEGDDVIACDLKYLKVTKIEKHPYSGKVFNLEVAEDNSYALENGAFVHNCKIPVQSAAHFVVINNGGVVGQCPQCEVA